MCGCDMKVQYEWVLWCAGSKICGSGKETRFEIMEREASLWKILPVITYVRLQTRDLVLNGISLLSFNFKQIIDLFFSFIFYHIHMKQNLS